MNEAWYRADTALYWLFFNTRILMRISKINKKIKKIIRKRKEGKNSIQDDYMKSIKLKKYIQNTLTKLQKSFIVKNVSNLMRIRKQLQEPGGYCET